MLEALLIALGTCQVDRKPLEGLPKEIRAHVGDIQKPASCQVSSLPANVRAVLATATGARDLGMADPGETWNSSCVGSGLRHQLLRAVHSERAWVVDFRSGGFAVTNRVVVIGVQGDAATLLFDGHCTGGKRWGKSRCEEYPRRRE